MERRRSGVTAVLSAALLSTALATAANAGCPDISGNGDVGFEDLLAVLAAWGPCAGCPEDLDGNGDVGFADLLEVLAAWGPCPPVKTITELELAGNALSGFPFFEYVTAFNENAVVSIAVDPHIHPGIVGAVGLAYVVADKTAAEWDGDPTLVDVRGAAQGVAFGGPDVQDATVALTSFFDGGTDFAIGYDVVIDLDLDGMLSPGDYIDGYSSVGFHGVKDTTTLGPFAVSSITYSGGSFLGQKTYYPTAIGGMGQLPLFVISHGNGHDYTWYDYLGNHLASHGYIVMSHQNNTVPGIETASTTTLTNTDYILGNQATIGGGVLNGHIDGHTIIWAGHSRGGEGVARAYDRIFDGSYNPVQFDLADVVLISSIAPTDFLGTDSANPHGVDYHLLYGSADGDVSGAPDCNICQSFHLLERATGERASTYVQGADHNDFNCCGFNDFQGPAGTQIGRPEAQDVAKGAYLALVKHFIEGHPVAKELLWRQYESIRPISVASTTIVDNEYKDDAANKQVIDDFQTQFMTTISSSGGAVTSSVTNLSEGRLDDNDAAFTWLVTDPMNGMTRAMTTDTTRGAVFDYSGTDFAMEFEVVAGSRDLTEFEYLSLRAAQGTRHPNNAAAGDRTFTVTLVDGSGGESSIDIGVYLGGVEKTYARTGFGVGAGWQNEFETIRVRLSDFLRNGTVVDLTNVVAIRLEFGSNHGSSAARLGLDDVELTGP